MNARANIGPRHDQMHADKAKIITNDLCLRLQEIGRCPATLTTEHITQLNYFLEDAANRAGLREDTNPDWVRYDKKRDPSDP